MTHHITPYYSNDEGEMHFSAILLAALSAGAHSLPTADPTIGGDLASSITCMSMSANGGPWRSLAIAECYPDAKTDNPGVPEAEG